jgi:hypothetical protein
MTGPAQRLASVFDRDNRVARVIRSGGLMKSLGPAEFDSA